MQEKKRTTKYLWPVMFALILVVSLVSGVFMMRKYLMKLTADERSNQLEEMVTQVRSNLSVGLQTHWNLVIGMDKAICGKHFEDEEELCGDIARLEEIFCLDLYSSHVMLLDEQGTAYLDSGRAGIWNDVSRLIDGEIHHTFVSETDNIEGCFMVFAQDLSEPVTVGADGLRITHIVLLKDIQTLGQYYTTDTYGGDASTYVIRRNGTLAFFDSDDDDDDDAIGARNVYKALREAEYVQNNQSFDTVEEKLKKEGIAAANIYLRDEEYYYCLIGLDEYSMTLMLLIPADSVASSTVDMMNTAIIVGGIFVSAIALLMLMTAVSFIKTQRSRQLVELEQETNRELNRLRLEAESANSAKSTFLNNMSHDIRTPMNAIIGFTNIAMKQEPPPQVRSCLEKISESSEHLLSLINDVLDISRIESGKIKFEPVPVDIKDITESVLTIVYGYLSNRNIEFRTELEELKKNRYVMTDPVRVREVLLNILGNAVKFTNDGGSITYAESFLSGEDERHIIVRYRISDTGIGMSDEFVRHIFEEFSQEEQNARTQYKGTGLGMTITKRYVDLMGGTIQVESRKGAGSTFTIDLPMEICEGNVTEKDERTSGNTDLSGIKVLLAEDNDLNAEIAMIQLEELGLELTRAVDGEDAVRLFADNPEGTFDLILMDIMMPKMNGYEATRMIRSLQAQHSDAGMIPVIAMTANAFAEDVQASLDAGMNGHLSKPIVLDEVVRTISHNVRKT